MNIAKLQKLKEFILAEPRRYNQGWWLYGPESNVAIKQKPPCGTVGCLAGNTVLMEGYVPAGSPWMHRFDYCKKPGKRECGVVSAAQNILSLSVKECNDLFDSGCYGWGEAQRRHYEKATTPLQQALAAAMEIDRLIALERTKRRKGSPGAK